MKKVVLYTSILFMLFSSTTNATIVSDNFNTYDNGSVVGQGGWESYSHNNGLVDGSYFIVQELTTLEGVRALYNNYDSHNFPIGFDEPSKIGKSGVLSFEGTQSFYIKPENRSSWHGHIAELRVYQTSWSILEVDTQVYPFMSLIFNADGHVTYRNGDYKVLGVFNNNEWNLVEMKWSSPYVSDQAVVGYRLNGGDWFLSGLGGFYGFDHVGLGVYAGPTGGVYFDTIGSIVVPEPSALSLVCLGPLILYRKRR